MSHDHAPTDSLTHLAGHHGDFEDFARLMQETSAGRFGPLWWGVWQQYVAPAVPVHGKVVDLGCGPGGLFAPLRQAHPEVEICGVELQPAMLRAARELAVTHRVQVSEADLASPLPFADNYFDAATAVMVLHELPFPIPLLQETFRILRSGGVFLLYDWSRMPLQVYAEGKPLDPWLIQHFREHCLYTPDDLAFLATSCGFVVQEVIGRRGGSHAMLALKKP